MADQLKVLYDHQIFSQQDEGGISRYFVELIRNARLVQGYSNEIAIKLFSNRHLKESGLTKGYSFFGDNDIRGRYRFQLTVNKVYCRQSIRRGEFDVFHPTYYDPYFIETLGDKPYVVTVYDLTHDLFPGQFRNEPYFADWMLEVLKGARRIIAISQNTKKDLLRFYPVQERSIDVVHLASSIRPSEPAPRRMDIPPRYVLFVGTREGYKNFEFFANAIQPILQSTPELFVVCTGGPRFTRKEADLFRQLHMVGRFLYFRADDKNLAGLYQSARCLAYPSLYEGFGLPILESFACGCPVVASNTSSIPEVAGDAAILFDPRDPVALQRALNDVLSDNDLRSYLVRKGRDRERRFSWLETAEQTLLTYRKSLLP